MKTSLRLFARIAQIAFWLAGVSVLIFVGLQWIVDYRETRRLEELRRPQIERLLDERHGRRVNLEAIPGVEKYLEKGSLTRNDLVRIGKLLGRIPDIDYQFSGIDVAFESRPIAVCARSIGWRIYLVKDKWEEWQLAAIERVLGPSHELH